MSQNETENQSDTMTALEVVFETEDYLVVNKPSGLLVHRTQLDFHETEFLLQRVRDYVGSHVYPLHRLDKATSGLVLFAKKPEVVSLFQKLWDENKIEKGYKALIRGWLLEPMTINHPLEQMAKKKDQKTKAHAEKKEAISFVKPLHHYEWDRAFSKFEKQRYSLVEVRIETGRKHQIRRHLSHIRHPILGDSNYGDNKHNREINTAFDNPGLLLQSDRMSFVCPISQKEISLNLELDSRFQKILPEFRKIQW